MALLVGVGILSGRNVHDAKSFATGGGSGVWMVCGIVMGTLVGGQSTVGTAQLAFCYGLSAWWFTIGAALGCVVLALVYAGPLRRSGCITLAEIIARRYGRRAETVGSILCLLGIFISIVAQVIASSAMMMSLLGWGMLPSALLSGALIVVFVYFGGIRGAGWGGLLKMALLYLSALVAAAVVLRVTGGFRAISADVAAVVEGCSLQGCDDVTSRFGSLVARGPLKDVGGGLSMLLGVLSTQTYAQAAWSARSNATARRGILLSALLIPIIGAACTLVGLFMRGRCLTADEAQALLAAGGAIPEGVVVIESTAQVFSEFVLRYCPPLLGGIVLGTLFVTVLGGGGGLALGAATIVVRDVWGNLARWMAQHKGALHGSNAIGALNSNATTSEGAGRYRFVIVLIAVSAVAISLLVKNSFINDLGFLSLGLRATALLLPLTCALFAPGTCTPRTAVATMVSGTFTMLLSAALDLPADPIFWGIGGAFVVYVVVRLAVRR